MKELMMAGGIRFARHGVTLMAHGSSTKMEYCICTPGVSTHDTSLREKGPWCLDKNKIQLEGAFKTFSPSEDTWRMSTCGPMSFRQVQSKVCQGLASQGRGTCTSGPISFMASKEEPQLLFHLPVIR